MGFESDKRLIWWISVRRSYIRANGSCKGLGEGPPSSLQAPSAHLAPPRPQSSLLSHSIGQFIMPALCTQPISEMLLVTVGMNFSP